MEPHAGQVLNTMRRLSFFSSPSVTPHSLAFTAGRPSRVPVQRSCFESLREPTVMRWPLIVASMSSHADGGAVNGSATSVRVGAQSYLSGRALLTG